MRSFKQYLLDVHYFKLCVTEKTKQNCVLMYLTSKSDQPISSKVENKNISLTL